MGVTNTNRSSSGAHTSPNQANEVALQYSPVGDHAHVFVDCFEALLHILPAIKH
jgi:hypothetical protein